MTHLFFVPLSKADEARHEVWGVAAIEQPDQSGEIMDYEKSKPNFSAWSQRVNKASRGKSLGNVRDSHTAKAVGKVVQLNFDDANKAVRVGVKVVDDNAWQKVEEGVFTGFSIGGAYGERWSDPLNKALTRYIAKPNEISLVDSPCIPGATFEMVKADGTHQILSKELDNRMKAKVKSILKKRLDDLSEEELNALAEQVAEVIEEESPSESEDAPQDESEQPVSEEEPAAEEETPAEEEAAEDQPAPLTAEAVRDIVLSVLAEAGILEQGGMQMSAKVKDLRKAFDGQKIAVGALQKSLTQVVDDLARLAVEVETLSKRGGSGPVLRELRGLDVSTSAALQQAEALKKSLASVTDPMAVQALRNEIARLEIQAVQTQK